MPDPDAIIRLRRDRLLGANLTGCDVKFCWMIQIRKFDESSAPPLAIEDFFRVYIASPKHEGGLGEFETVMQSRGVVKGLHNC